MSIEERVDGLQLAVITLKEAPIESEAEGLDRLLIQEQVAEGVGGVSQLLRTTENTLTSLAEQAYSIKEKGDASAKLICDVVGSSDQERMPASLAEALARAKTVSENGEQFAGLLDAMGDKLDEIDPLLRQVAGHLLEYHDLSREASKVIEATKNGRQIALTALLRYINAQNDPDS